MTDESRSPCSAEKPPAEKLTSAIRSVFSIPITPPDAPCVEKWLMPVLGSTCSIRLTSPAAPGDRRISSKLKLTVLTASSSTAEK